MFYVANRMVRPVAAGGITLLCVVASVPVYSAAVPSWYNLFFATFAIAALLRFLQKRSPWWLFAGGFCAGLSFLAKISGLYLLAGLVLFLIFFEQQESESRNRRRLGSYSLFLAAGLLAFVLVLLRTVSSIHPAYVAHFILPSASIVFYLLWREFSQPHEPSLVRSGRLLRLTWPVFAGFALPILGFLIPYARVGALHSLFVGLFVAPIKRLQYEALHPTHLRAMNLIATGMLAAFLYRASSERPFSRWQKLILILVLVGLLLASGPVHAVYSFVWSSMILLVPAATVIGVVLLAYRPHLLRHVSEVNANQTLFLLLAVLALTSLIQFPFAAPIYFCYITPLLILTLTALLVLHPRRNGFAMTAILVFYLAFWIFRATPGFIYNLGLHYSPDRQTATLALPRAGELRTEPKTADEYTRLISLIQQHAAGDYIYAAPDCPEVYFLAGKRNPTRALFDFLGQSEPKHNRHILEALDRDHVNVVAILMHPYFSRPIDPGLLEELAVRFPNSEVIGGFLVRWQK